MQRFEEKNYLRLNKAGVNFSTSGSSKTKNMGIKIKMNACRNTGRPHIKFDKDWWWNWFDALSKFKSDRALKKVAFGALVATFLRTPFNEVF